jgi:hypothetical protein
MMQLHYTNYCMGFSLKEQNSYTFLALSGIPKEATQGHSIKLSYRRKTKVAYYYSTLEGT